MGKQSLLKSTSGAIKTVAADGVSENQLSGNSKEQFLQLLITRICPNPWNPRRRFEGEKFDALVASISQKGVLEPILVRPLSDGPKLVEEKSWPNHGMMVDFEIVAGERRFRAMHKVAASNGGPESAVIPCIVKQLTDDEAFDVMTIENIQREDLTELEEAQNFKMYLDRKGPEAVDQLSERTGIHPAYIRRRVRVLSLPKKVLSMWDSGKLKYGHLEQLCRLKGTSEINDWCKRIEGNTFNGPWSVRELKDQINNASPELSSALFDIETEGCSGCAHNSDVQKKLFAVDNIEKTSCDSPKCFKQKTNNFLSSNWSKSALRKKYRTNGFIFDDAFDYRSCSVFYARKDVFADCKACSKFVTAIYATGRPQHERVCLDPRCHEKQEKSRRSTKNKKSDASCGDGAQNDGPRVAWHGEYFREKFYRDKIRERVEKIIGDELSGSWDDDKILIMLLLGILASNRSNLGEWFAKRHPGAFSDVDDYQYCFLDNSDVLKCILSMTRDQVCVDLAEAAIELVLSGAVYPDNRRSIGDLLGIDLAEEWRVTDEYLSKKTTAELLDFGEQSGIFQDMAALAFISGLGRRNFKACKKSELAKVFLESGADLAGKVPDEILS